MSVRPTSLLRLRPTRLALARTQPVLTARLALPSSSSFARRSFASSPSRLAVAPEQDPYTSKAIEEPSVQEKVAELQKALKTIQTSMLTTRAPDSEELHSRAMHAASTDGLTFTFFANRDSGKMDGIEKDKHVNISYCQDGGTWISIAGKANVSNDRTKIKELYSPMLKAWFGDNEKPNQRGDENDERIELIEVAPVEIRFFINERSTVGKLTEMAASAVTGGVAKPGKLLVLNGAELQQAKGVASK